MSELRCHVFIFGIPQIKTKILQLINSPVVNYEGFSGRPRPLGGERSKQSLLLDPQKGGDEGDHLRIPHPHRLVMVV